MRSFPLMPLLLAAVAAIPGIPSTAQAQARPAARPAAHPPAAPAPAAASASTAGPKSIGRFDDWQAATHQEGGQLVCYAFTRSSRSTPALQGRGDVVLTVTQRGSGRDAVALSAGFAYGPNAEVQVVVDQSTLPFYTSGRSAFARDGKAAVAAFNKGRQATAKSPAPRGQQVSDTFSLRGFEAAYAAINKACPPR